MLLLEFVVLNLTKIINLEMILLMKIIKFSHIMENDMICVFYFQHFPYKYACLNLEL